MAVKVTFITTIYNEEDTIVYLLDSLLKQSVMPNEIIIVDAHSTDRTVELIESYRKKFGRTEFRLFSKKGNRSTGRNYAIKKSTNDVIVATDSGCILDRNWLKNISSPFFTTKIDVVAGFYKPVTNNIFEKCLATYTCTMYDKVTSDFLPSSRSIAFRKQVWQKVGGYPEELDTCEDLVFDKKLKKLGASFKVVKNAVVFWPQRKNIIEAALQFYNYAVGDGQASYIRINTWLLFARYAIAIFLLMYSPNILLMCFAFYILWSIAKNFKYIQNIQALIYLPLLQIVSDIAVILGTTKGKMKNITVGNI